MFNGYNESYLEEYAYEASIPLGRAIIQNRWKTVKLICSSGKLLDYGCGTGVFHESAPDGFDATGWDVNPHSRYSGLRPTGKFDILTFWDVLEHVPAPLIPTTDYRPKFVFVTAPNASNTTIDDFESWKHFKPIEHIHYYTLQTLTMSFASIGYRLIYNDFKEGALRNPQNPEDILTAVYAK